MARWIVSGLLLLATGRANGQSQPEGQNALNEYKPGQVWTIGHDITVTILAVEDVRRVGKVVHVRVDKIPLQSCGEIHLTRTIEHLALTEKMMRKSGLDLLKENGDLPESSVEAYRKWQEQKKREVFKVPIQKAILTVGDVPGPMICNLVPTRA